ncbi:MAG TPA: hypothetical protein VMT20_23540, partial [Terriglobia bacterium]|nr:hypothetical protein [Terriglobia bacterium]
MKPAAQLYHWGRRGSTRTAAGAGGYWCHSLGGTLRGAVIPAKAGIHFLDTFFLQGLLQWIPAFAGM